jgi:NADPH-dependent 2,4-dienoyl-CoA reductase/sulfur reductase-like enzyme
LAALQKSAAAIAKNVATMNDLIGWGKPVTVAVAPENAPTLVAAASPEVGSVVVPSAALAPSAAVAEPQEPVTKVKSRGESLKIASEQEFDLVVVGGGIVGAGVAQAAASRGSVGFAD